jgi:23S rRNA (cytosine1962-C5)-methyltransferase
MAFEAVKIAWPAQRLVHRDARVVVVDKPRGLPVHGGNPEIFDVVTRVSRFLSEAGDSEYLSVHSRLDKEVSGLLVLGHDPADNPRIAKEFEAHRVTRRYLAVVRDSGIPSTFEMRDQLRPHETGRTEIVKSGGVEAVTEGFVRARRDGRALVELLPKTGRRHQLRVQLASRDAPIYGDALYGGDPALRLLLHAFQVENAALGWHFEGNIPEEFADLGQNLTLGTPARLKGAVFDAAFLRASLFSLTETLRLVNAEGDALPGLTVDAYGGHAVVELLSDEAIARRIEIVEAVAALGAASVYVKCRVRRDLRHEDVQLLAPSLPDVGCAAPTPMLVKEQGVPVEVALGDGWDTGLYVDQRENRQRVRGIARGRSLLNLFSYTGMFSVAAALGGAKSTTTVDLSGRALDRARRNFALSEIDTAAIHRFIKADAVDWLARARRRGEKFGLIVLDPPSFSTVGKGRVFRLDKTWDLLMEHTLSLLEQKGQMLLVSHERATSPSSLRRRVLKVAETLRLSTLAVRDVPQGVDFPSPNTGPWPSFALWVELR